METPVMSSRVLPTVGGKDERPTIQTRKSISSGSQHGDGFDLARWVAQLDAAQREACAAYVQDRLRLLDRLLRIVVDAKRM
jgi:hypothetical protein